MVSALGCLDGTSTTFTTITDYGPGHIRWGRNLGCTFLNKPASEWPNHYTCQHMAERSCSPDNRMAAVCNLHDWDEV